MVTLVRKSRPVVELVEVTALGDREPVFLEGGEIAWLVAWWSDWSWSG